MTFVKKSLDSDLILCSFLGSNRFGRSWPLCGRNSRHVYVVFYVITLCCHRDVLATTVQEAAGYAMAMKLPPCGGVTIILDFLRRFKGEIRTRPQAVWCRPEVPGPSGYFWGRNVWQA